MKRVKVLFAGIELKLHDATIHFEPRKQTIAIVSLNLDRFLTTVLREFLKKESVAIVKKAQGRIEDQYAIYYCVMKRNTLRGMSVDDVVYLDGAPFLDEYDAIVAEAKIALQRGKSSR